MIVRIGILPRISERVMWVGDATMEEFATLHVKSNWCESCVALKVYESFRIKIVFHVDFLFSQLWSILYSGENL